MLKGRKKKRNYDRVWKYIRAPHWFYENTTAQESWIVMYEFIKRMNSCNTFPAKKIKTKKILSFWEHTQMSVANNLISLQRTLKKKKLSQRVCMIWSEIKRLDKQLLQSIFTFPLNPQKTHKNFRIKLGENTHITPSKKPRIHSLAPPQTFPVNPPNKL